MVCGTVSGRVVTVPWSHSLQLADYPSTPQSVMDMLPPAEVQDRQIIKQQLQVQKVTKQAVLLHISVQTYACSFISYDTSQS